MIKLTLPLPPTVNHYYTIARNRKILSKQGRIYKALVKTTCQSLGLGSAPLVGGLVVSVLANFPDKRKRDLDNVLKPLLDALGDAGLYHDDSAINSLMICRGVVLKPGSVTVSVFTEGSGAGNKPQPNINGPDNH